MRAPAALLVLPAISSFALSGAACRRGATHAPDAAGRRDSDTAETEVVVASVAEPAETASDARDGAGLAPPTGGPDEGEFGEPTAGCPAGMAPIEGVQACIDRWEAAIEDGRAVARPGRRPAERTSWREADAACRAAGRRLCTLAEWEAACAGAAGRRFPYGDDFVAGRCHDATRSGDAAGPSGGLPGCVTPEGVFDLSGNVWEWTADAVQEGEVHELRGGGWGNGEPLLRCRPDERLLQPPDEPHTAYGFRCCADR
ncbi:MAG: formylglycine-generating enzyme family protein [Myxococcales bacterium]|nr:formylglycine-generating enzyme family protein [Myxococcales bacterium]